MADGNPPADGAAAAAAAAGADGAAGGELNSATLRLPDFWHFNPKAWFRNVDSNFITRRITSSSTKYHHIIRHLDHKAVKELDDVLDDESLVDDYDTLKARIISRFASSTEEKLRELVSNQELGDRTPSQLLRHMRSLSEKNINDKLLGTIWSDRLPLKVQTVIASQLKTLTLDQVAEIADDVYKLLQGHPAHVSAAAAAPAAGAAAHKPDKLDEVLRRLELMEARLNERGRAQDRSTGGRAQGRRRSSSRSKSSNNSDFCYYHNRFGAKAEKCRAPCKFSATEASN